MSGRRRAYFGIGSNLGDRLANLQGAVDGLAAADRVDVAAVSPVYETDPIGPDQPEYLNAVVAADTDLPAHDLLVLGQRLEAEAHRVRTVRWGPRTLDVDVLLVGDEVLDEPDLVVPHPRMWERGFVMVPLRDLVPDVRAPGAAEQAEVDRGWPGVQRTGLALSVP